LLSQPILANKSFTTFGLRFRNDFSPQTDCFALDTVVNQTFDLVSFRKTTSEVVFTEHQSWLSTFRFELTSRKILFFEVDYLLASVVTSAISAKSDIWFQSFSTMSTFCVGFLLEAKFLPHWWRQFVSKPVIDLYLKELVPIFLSDCSRKNEPFWQFGNLESRNQIYCLWFNNSFMIMSITLTNFLDFSTKIILCYCLY